MKISREIHLLEKELHDLLLVEGFNDKKAGQLLDRIRFLRLALKPDQTGKS